MTEAMLDTMLDAAPRGHVERTLEWLLDEQSLLSATEHAAESVRGER